MNYEKKIILLFSITLLFPEKVYVTLQMLDQVGVMNIHTQEIQEIVGIDLQASCSGIIDEESCSLLEDCVWMMNMCMQDDGGMQMSETPHFIAVDEINGFWFVSTISSGYIARYDLLTDEYIDRVFVGDSPALLTVNKQDKKLYCSRMMPMGGMMSGSTSTIVQEIDFSGPMLISTNEFAIPSPAPHGISINGDGSEIYVASNTADWIYKILPGTSQIFGSVMDEEISNFEEIETHRLKPIQCLSVADSLLFVSCSGGLWVDPWTGAQEQITGQIQLWNSNTMSSISSYEFDWTSTPWHIINSPVDEKIYVVLSGDQLYPGSAGVAALSYTDSELVLDWFTTNELFNTLHGIDISADGETLYVSGRGDGYLHILNAGTGELNNSVPLATNPSMAMLGGVATIKLQEIFDGDVNLDNDLNIFDIVIIVGFIVNNNPLTYAQITAADINIDGAIDVLDIIILVNRILR